ncbi:MAG: hypothetical protein JO199_03650 [Candidatus Eremiobacteraeota bacterium]|nr:hypothetical protein [Candidatus Eremiobacteraeota bacterium]
MTAKWLLGLLTSCIVAACALSLQAPALAEGSAHFTVVTGAVTVHGANGTQAAASGGSLTPGDYVASGQTARAEVDLNGNAILRLAGGVEAHYIDRNQIQIAQGTIEVSVLQGGYGSTQVDTPSVTVRASAQGACRIAIAADGSTYVTVRQGHVDIVTPSRTYTIEAGTSIVASGPATHPVVTTTTAVASDSFDDFVADRDRALLEQTTSAPADSSYPLWGSTTNNYYYGGTYGYPWGGAIVASGFCGFAPYAGTGYGGWGWSWGVSFGFGYAGGCYPGVAYAGYSGWYPPWYYYSNSCCGYWGAPYPYSPPIVVIHNGCCRAVLGGRAPRRPVTPPASPRRPVAVVARLPIVHVPIATRPLVPTPIRPPHPVTRVAVAPRAPLEKTFSHSSTEDAWQRYDRERGAVREPAHDPVVERSPVWDRYTETRGAVSVKPDPIVRAPESGTHTWNPISTGINRPIGDRPIATPPIGVPHSLGAPVHVGAPSGAVHAGGGGRAGGRP